jgi:hypothetical protein
MSLRREQPSLLKAGEDIQGADAIGVIALRCKDAESQVI